MKIEKIPAGEEQRARARHETLPPLPDDASGEERWERRRRGGRPPGKRLPLEKRIRRAYDAGRSSVILAGNDVTELKELYDDLQEAVAKKGTELEQLLDTQRVVLGKLDRVQEQLGLQWMPDELEGQRK